MPFSSRAAVASMLCTSAAFLLGGCAASSPSSTAPQASAPAYSAPPSGGLSRTLVGKADVSVPGREAVVAKVEVAPGARAGRHTHPGDEISYISEGQVDLLIDGQPPRTLKAGESFVVHDAHNASNAAVKL